VAERFEVYLGGVELANGFSELNDASEQRERCEKELAKRVELGLAPLPLPEKFLTALEVGMPDAGGVALGLDRLFMVWNKSNKLLDLE